MKSLISTVLLALLSITTATNAAMLPNGSSSNGDTLVIYNWNDYMGSTTLADFTKATGIKVVYKQYSTNEEMEKGIVAGRGVYDIVVPTARPYFARMVQGGLLRPLDKSKIPNITNLDSGLMQSVQDADPGNKFGVIYAWGTSGVGFNSDAIKKRMPSAPLHSWEMVFDPVVVLVGSRFHSKLI